jgi:hypothetical protein
MITEDDEKLVQTMDGLQAIQVGDWVYTCRYDQDPYTMVWAPVVETRVHGEYERPYRVKFTTDHPSRHRSKETLNRAVTQIKAWRSKDNPPEESA